MVYLSAHAIDTYNTVIIYSYFAKFSKPVFKMMCFFAEIGKNVIQLKNKF